LALKILKDKFGLDFEVRCLGRCSILALTTSQLFMRLFDKLLKVVPILFCFWPLLVMQTPALSTLLLITSQQNSECDQHAVKLRIPCVWFCFLKNRRGDC